MKQNFSAVVAGGSLVGALLFTLVFPATPAAAQSSSGAHDPRVSAARRGPPPNIQRAPIPRAPVVNPNAGIAPRVYRGPPSSGPRGPVGVVGPGYRGPVGPRGPVGVVGPGYRGPAVGFRPSWRGGRAAFIRGPHRINRGGIILPLVALGALGAIYVGSRQYTPYAYVDGPVGPECQGPTDDGVCELRMTEVPLETGGVELQCVAYCPPQ